MSQNERRFALRKDAADDFRAAKVTLPDEVLDVGELLQKGKGVIVTDDPNRAEALATVDVLKEVSQAEAAEITKAAGKRGGKGK